MTATIIASLVGLLGTAGMAILAFVWRAQRDAAQADTKVAKSTAAQWIEKAQLVAQEKAVAIEAAETAASVWKEREVALLADLAARDQAQEAHYDEFKSLVATCGDAAVPVLVPWAQRVFAQGAGSISGVTGAPGSSPAAVPAKAATAGAVGGVPVRKPAGI